MVVTVYMRCITLTSAGCFETEYVITLYCATDTLKTIVKNYYHHPLSPIFVFRLNGSNEPHAEKWKVQESKCRRALKFSFIWWMNVMTVSYSTSIELKFARVFLILHKIFGWCMWWTDGQLCIIIHFSTWDERKIASLYSMTIFAKYQLQIH